MLQSTALSAIAPHFFTARTSPVLPSGNGTSDWAAVAAHIGVPAERLWRFDQVHGTSVERIAAAAVLQTPPVRADAAVTGRRDVALSVKVADCVPLLIADSQGQGVAAVHAGWRGAAAGIVERAVEALAAETGADPARLVAAVGPSIGACCYEVGDEVRAAFHATAPSGGEDFSSRDGRWRLDLWRAVRRRLESTGMQAANIHVAALCTATHLEWFYSYRKQGAGAGRMLGVIRRK